MLSLCCKEKYRLGKKWCWTISVRFRKMSGRGRNLYLTVETANGTPVELVIWPMNLKPWDQANPGYYETGFSALLAPTKSETFTVRISPEN